MKLQHKFTVPASVDQAWEALLDVERVASCMPGATLLTIDGDDAIGTVKVKVGPVQVVYNGKASFLSKDQAAHCAVIKASGKETRGAGAASATVTTVLEEVEGGTTVQVETDLEITGRAAQFGRGVMAEVGGKLIGQFATRLAETLQPSTSIDVARTGGRSVDTDRTGSATNDAATHPSHGDNTSSSHFVRSGSDPEPIDLLEVARGSIAKRLGPTCFVIFIVAIIAAWRRRGQRRADHVEL